MFVILYCKGRLSTVLMRKRRRKTLVSIPVTRILLAYQVIPCLVVWAKPYESLLLSDSVLV